MSSNLVFVAAPYSGPSKTAIERNVSHAVVLGALAVSRGLTPIVPHAQGWLSVYGAADESDPGTRERALRCSVELARLVGTQRGALWVVEREDGSVTEGTQADLDAFLSGYADAGASRAEAEQAVTRGSWLTWWTRADAARPLFAVAQAFTEDELARLEVNLGDLPGLDPSGLPAVAYQGGETDPVLLFRRVDEHSTYLAWIDRDTNEPYLFDEIRDSAITLNLAADATAERVARWKAKQVGVRVGGGVVWRRRRNLRSWELLSSEADIGGEKPIPAHFRHSFALVDVDPAEMPRRDGKTWVRTEGLLDTADERRLRGGALYLDRLALALVAKDRPLGPSSGVH